MATANYPNENAIAAQNALNAAALKLQTGGLKSSRDLLEIIRTALTAGGFDFSSRANIDSFERSLEPEYRAFQKREIALTDEYRKLLIEAGATELELEWENFNNVRPTFRQAVRLERVGKKIDKCRIDALPLLSLIAVLNEAKKTLE